jgi:hypothetical protein
VLLSENMIDLIRQGRYVLPADGNIRSILVHDPRRVDAIPE